MAFLNRSVRYAIGRQAIQGGIELVSSNRDIGRAMGRPRKFSREGGGESESRPEHAWRKIREFMQMVRAA